ncbi:MAG: hypothetical protein JXJ18_03860 [Rhodobacteraceae bacterium]|nr:hypothetical protein [Paracoccaceae bacterium]
MNTPLLVASLAAGLAVATSAPAQTWSGSVEGGLYATDRTSTDTDIEGSPFAGAYIGGMAENHFGAYRFSIDGRVEYMSDQGKDDPYVTGPVHSGVLGLHFGREFGASYVGAYVATGIFDGYNSNSPMSGSMYGLEASHTITGDVNVFGQAGYMRAIGDANDNEYKGFVARLGMSAPLTDRLNAMVSLDGGRSDDCFVDCGNQPGRYIGLTIEADYALNDKYAVVGSISHMSVYDEDDDDTGTDTSLFLGVRMNFGATGSSKALTTPISGFRAAGWMEPLD